MMQRGYYVFIKNLNSNEKLDIVFSSILGIPKNKFEILQGYVVDNLDEDGNLNIKDDVNICELLRVGGDFRYKIELGVKSENLPSEIEFSKKLAQSLQTECLIGSKEINPYHWIYIDSNGDVKPVYIDSDKFDQDDEFVIDRDA